MPRFAPAGDSLEIRALTTSLKTRLLDRAGLRALLAAEHFMAIALGTPLSDWRSRPDSERDLVGQRVEASYQLPLALSAAKILRERWKKVPERRRPHYTPSQRFEILKIRAALVLSVRETAAMFAVAESTIYEWESLLRKPIAGLQHSGLKGATPAEVFLQLPPAHLAAVPPPRGKPGQVIPFPEHEVEFLAPGLPVFRRKAA